MVLTIVAVSADSELKRLLDNVIKNKALLYLTSVFSFLTLLRALHALAKSSICVDIRQANTAIKRVRYPIPTVEDIRQELNGARRLSKLDLSQAYHQLELSDSSRIITTFSTKEGLFRNKT